MKNKRLEYIMGLIRKGYGKIIPYINKTAIIKGIIGDGCHIDEYVVINDCVKIGNNVVIFPGAKIGGQSVGFEHNEDGDIVRFPQFGNIVIEDNVVIGSNVTIDRGTTDKDTTIIGKNTIIANLCQIAHNVVIGSNCGVLGGSIVAGGVVIGDRTTIGMGARILNKVSIGKNCIVGAGAVVTKDVGDNSVVTGVPAKFKRYTVDGGSHNV